MAAFPPLTKIQRSLYILLRDLKPRCQPVHLTSHLSPSCDSRSCTVQASAPGAAAAACQGW
eukprot:765878-Hanusia_phi.AAC.4